MYQNRMFTIKSITGRVHDTSSGGYPWKIEVTIQVDAKYWAKLKAKRNLGMLYGVDVSNAVYAINENIPAHNPMVSDSARASKGFKTIQLTYFLSDPVRAKSLGFSYHESKSGVYPKYGEHIRVEIPSAELKLVVNN